jgi:hypothetical protein
MLLAWLIMAVAMSLNGIFRVKILAVRWGDVWAGVASAASGIALIQLIARQAMGIPTTGRQRIRIATLWLFLTLIFEFTFGHYVDKKSWAELIANYNLFRGQLWPIVLASLILAPFVWRRGCVISATHPRVVRCRRG